MGEGRPGLRLVPAAIANNRRTNQEWAGAGRTYRCKLGRWSSRAPVPKGRFLAAAAPVRTAARHSGRFLTNKAHDADRK